MPNASCALVSWGGGACDQGRCSNERHLAGETKQACPEVGGPGLQPTHLGVVVGEEIEEVVETAPGDCRQAQRAGLVRGDEEALGCRGAF
jgi:hypothetical protein